jgi:hypothetical protein
VRRIPENTPIPTPRANAIISGSIRGLGGFWRRAAIPWKAAFRLILLLITGRFFEKIAGFT